MAESARANFQGHDYFFYLLVFFIIIFCQRGAGIKQPGAVDLRFG